MSRLPELTCGIIGSFLAILISVFTFSLITIFAPFNRIAFSLWDLNGFAVFVSMISLVLCFFLSKQPKIISIIFIAIGITLVLINFLHLIPSTLLVIAGLLGLFKKVDDGNIIKTSQKVVE